MIKNGQRLRKKNNKGKSINPLKPSHNLNGVDVNDVIPTQKQPTNLISPNLAGNEINVLKNLKTTYMLRVSMHIQSQNSHAPTMIKELVKILRMADPTFNILPFDKQNMNTNQILDNEDSMPNDQESLKTWIYGLQTTKANRLKFSLRGTFTKQLREVKGVTFDWCKRHKNFVVFDKLMSAEVFHAGWIIGIHPRFHDRDTLKKWLDECENAIPSTQFNLIPRKVYVTDDNSSRTITNAIAIDVAFEAKESALKFLYQIPWETSLYPEATFIPFRVTPTFTIQSQIGAMQLQNSYLHDTHQKVLKTENATLTFKNKNNGDETLVTWLRNVQNDEGPIFKQVEASGIDFVKIIYHTKHRENVTNYVRNLYDNFSNQFGDEQAVKILGQQSDIQYITTTTEIEEQYTSALAGILQANPQSPSPQTITPPPVPRSVYYGTTPIRKNSATKTFSEAVNSSQNTTPAISQSIQQQIQFLTDKTNNLEKTINEKEPDSSPETNFEQLKKDIQTSIMEKVEATIEKKISILDTNLENTINEVKKEQEKEIAALQSLITTTSQNNAKIIQQQAEELEARTILRENSNTAMIIQQMQTMFEQNIDPSKKPKDNASVRAVEQSSCHGVAT